MTDHDQFFKNLLQEFFGDLLRIVAPELAVRLRVGEPAFLESELFTSLLKGKRRYLDLVARVEALEGEEPKVLLVHVEIERQARKAMGLRLLDYAIQWDDAAQEEYEALLAEEGGAKVAIMETTWADRLRAEGVEQGREQGKRELLLEQLERRFGPLSQATVQRVRAISSDELSRLAARVLDAGSLDDLGL